MTEAIAIREVGETAIDRPHPREIVAQATEEANVLAGVIEKQKLFSMIQGKRFVKVEGWVTLATLRGCLPREVEVQELPEGRYVAIVELVRMSDGAVLTRASAECGGAGDTIWMSRPSNARRSMAITRATGKAARVAFSWVMALAGFEVTPAEEMDHVGGQSQTEDNSGPTPRATQAPSRQGSARGVPSSENDGVREAASVGDATPGFVLGFGKHKGMHTSEVDNGYLHFLIDSYEKNILDPAKESYKNDNTAKLRALVAEKARRMQNAQPDEADLPFGK